MNRAPTTTKTPMIPIEFLIPKLKWCIDIGSDDSDSRGVASGSLEN